MHKSNPNQSVVYLHQQRGARKGAVIVMVAVLLVVLLGCVALAVDIGYLYVARTELQRAADAAAMAGAQALGRSSQDSPLGDYYQSSEEVYSEAEKYARLNTAVGQGVVLDRHSDVKIGFLEFPHDLTASLQTVALDQANAVHVIARRNSANADGQIKLFFAPIWGLFSAPVSASAIAVLDDRFYGYAPKKTIGGCPVIPFAVDEAVWEDQIVNGNGPDEYTYDADNENVLTAPDMTPEIRLFPEQLGPPSQGGHPQVEGAEAGDTNAGSGNFGLLNIGPSTGTAGTSTIVRQINEGISAEDLNDMTGEPMIRFYNQVSGEPVVFNAVSYDVTGDPGIKAGVEDAMQAKIGEVVGFFLYKSVTEQGSNAIFDIVGMRFGRVMQVELSGSVGGGNTTMKAIIIQKVAYYGPDIMTSSYVPSTDRTIGRLELVR